MLEEYMQSSRVPTLEETKVIELLVAKANYKKMDWKKELKVVDIPDGMGSLLLIPQGQSNTKRLFKAQISEALFKDIDDVDVLISLNIDQNDLLYELDIWKMNYGPLISFANLFTDNGNIKQTLSWE